MVPLRSLVAAAIVASLLAAPRVAGAEPTAADRETARTLMQEARDLRDAGDVQGALKRFQAADEIMRVPSTGFEVARTQVALGLLLEARDTIAAIRRVPPKPDEPEPFKEARANADKLDASLEGRIPSLTIVVQGAPEGTKPAITIDGVPVPPALVGFARVVDPGHHVVVAKTAGKEGRAEVDVAEGQRKELQVALAASAEASAPPTAPPPPEAPAPSGPVSHGPTMVTYAGAAVAGAGVLVGAVTGIMSWSKTSSLGSECNAQKQCGGAAASDYDSAHTLATVSNVSFALAGVGAAVAVVTLVVGHEQPLAAPPATGVRVVPWIGAGAGGIAGTF